MTDSIEKLLADMRETAKDITWEYEMQRSVMSGRILALANRLQAMTREAVFPTDEESRAGGWTLSFSFLKDIQKRAILKTEEVSYIELEDIESVLLAARSYFTAQPSPSVPDGWLLFPVEAWKFLTGEGPLNGRWFGEAAPGERPFWWRSHIRAMLAAAPQTDDPWQPVETAPKDGTEVLVWCQRCALVPVAMHFTSKEYLEREYGDPDYMGEGWYMSYSYPDGFPEITWEPTHWKPFEPPKGVE